MGQVQEVPPPVPLAVLGQRAGLQLPPPVLLQPLLCCRRLPALRGFREERALRWLGSRASTHSDWPREPHRSQWRTLAELANQAQEMLQAPPLPALQAAHPLHGQRWVPRQQGHLLRSQQQQVPLALPLVVGARVPVLQRDALVAASFLPGAALRDHRPHQPTGQP